MHIRQNQDGGLATHPDGVAMAGQSAVEAWLEGVDGNWVGSGWVLVWMSGPEVAPEDEWVEWVELLTLDGDGAYESLSATLTSNGYSGVPGRSPSSR